MKMLSNRTGGFLPALILAVMLVLGLSAHKAQAQDYYDDYGNGDYQEFYDDLSPHGQWLNDPQYGYVWTPNVGGDFRPYYTNGRWVMTEYGNTWVSDYSWGWAPFHYGRWAQSSYYGWIWIPGREWGPAWVNWRQGGGYYGWAPMGPGISINISFGGGYNVPNPWWTFIPCGNIYTPGWQRYYSPRRTVNIINNTTIINNTYVDNRTRNTYVTGPRRTEIEAVTRQRVNVYNVSNRTRPGATNISGRSVQVYRPSVERSSGRAQVNAAPRQAKTLERSVITNAGGGRAPSRQAATQQQNSRIDRTGQMREAQRNQQNARPELQQRAQRDQQQQRVQQASRQRDLQMQRDQQIQQQRVQRDQQQQRVQQADQQKNMQMQREQQMQQQRMQRDQQQQRVQQADQQRNMQMQREQQMQQQRIQRDQQQQRVQQADQQRMQRDQQMQQQRVQREQQMQQRQQMQQQRSVERAQPQPQRIERSAPQQQRMERSAPQPQQRNAERAPRGR
jgi:hypothetical protein